MRSNIKKNFPQHHESHPHLVSHFAYADFILKELKANPRIIQIAFKKL